MSAKYFPDNDDVQYETMEVYPFSWIYYMSFIFFTAFAFLNMVIGIVVNVMEEEHSKAKAQFEPSPSDLQKEIRELKVMISTLTNEQKTKSIKSQD